MLNTLHLYTFLVVVELGTYSAAAERLHLTQPAVSQQISLLEKQLGDVRLFRRVAQRMVLTHAGEELLPAAREIVGLAERTEESLLALRGHITGRVVLACSSSSGERVLPPLLAAFRARFPAVAVALEVAPAEQVVALLDEGRAQIGWLDEPQRRRGWESMPVGREPVVCCVPPQHAWLHEETITVGMLREQPLILPRPGTALRRSLEEGWRRAGLHPAELQVALECDSVGALLAAIEGGVGLGFVPLSCQPSHSRIGAVPLRGLPLSLEWYVVGSKDPALGRAVHECRAFLSGREAAPLLRQAGIEAV